MGALLTLVALANARVVIVSPIVATTPLFSLTISLIFLRGKEQEDASDDRDKLSPQYRIGLQQQLAGVPDEAAGS